MCCSHLTDRMRDNVWEMLQAPGTPEEADKAVDYLVC
jgi:hypothetical protein